jgi:hypothetical protein
MFGDAGEAPIPKLQVVLLLRNRVSVAVSSSLNRIQVYVKFISLSLSRPAKIREKIDDLI